MMNHEGLKSTNSSGHGIGATVRADRPFWMDISRLMANGCMNMTDFRITAKEFIGPVAAQRWAGVMQILKPQ